MAAVIRRKLPFEKYGQRIDLVVLTIVFFDIRLGRIFGSIGVYASAAARCGKQNRGIGAADAVNIESAGRIHPQSGQIFRQRVIGIDIGNADVQP